MKPFRIIVLGGKEIATQFRNSFSRHGGRIYKLDRQFKGERCRGASPWIVIRKSGER